MTKFLILFIIINILFFNSGCENKNEVNNPIPGKWQSLRNDGANRLTINFKNNNTFRTEVARSSQSQIIDGRYKVSIDTMFICDAIDKPTQICDYNDTGIYLFTNHGDTLFFQTIADNCEKRKLTFEMGLDKIK